MSHSLDKLKRSSSLSFCFIILNRVIYWSVNTVTHKLNIIAIILPIALLSYDLPRNGYDLRMLRTGHTTRCVLFCKHENVNVGNWCYKLNGGPDLLIVLECYVMWGACRHTCYCSPVRANVGGRKLIRSHPVQITLVVAFTRVAFSLSGTRTYSHVRFSVFVSAFVRSARTLSKEKKH